MATEPPFITRVVIENYKSIAHCDVPLGALTFLVGRNGAGKSNFLDALSFLADALRTSLDSSLRTHGYIYRRLGGVFPALGIRVDFGLPDGQVGRYGFQIGEHQPGKHYSLHREECKVWHADNGQAVSYFRVIDGKVESSSAITPAALANHLYLVNASGLPEFTAAYQALAAMQIYALDANRMRRSASVGEEGLLAADGGNISGVVLWLMNHQPDVLRRIIEYLQIILPGIEDVYAFEFGGEYHLAFKLGTRPLEERLGPESMSDGTLRALGVLVALLQQTPSEERSLSLIAIEEPEISLHPGAMAVIRAALQDAIETTQVLVTTQSTDLLDNKEVDPSWIRVVVAANRLTQIGPLSEASRSIIRDHLTTAGELFRTSPLEPVLPPQPSSAAPELFDD